MQCERRKRKKKSSSFCIENVYVQSVKWRDWKNENCGKQQQHSHDIRSIFCVFFSHIFIYFMVVICVWTRSRVFEHTVYKHVKLLTFDAMNFKFLFSSSFIFASFLYKLSTIESVIDLFRIMSGENMKFFCDVIHTLKSKKNGCKWTSELTTECRMNIVTNKLIDLSIFSLRVFLTSDIISCLV